MAAATNKTSTLMYDCETKFLGGGESICTLSSTKDSKTYRVICEPSNWTRFNTYSIYQGNTCIATAQTGLRGFFPSFWSPRDSIYLKDPEGNAIGKIAAGFLQSFPATLIELMHLLRT